MQRIVPSQVVAVIDKLFPAARTQLEGKQLLISAGLSSSVAIVLDLVERIPSELIVLEEDRI